MTKRIAILVIYVAAACGGGSDPQPAADAESTADAFESDCGFPGDVGNELGIGKFCASIADCSNTVEAPLCSSLGSNETHFCTKTCQMGGPADQCGTATECVCNGNNQCGCTPSVCLGP
jgi:hypothetical protein